MIFYLIEKLDVFLLVFFFKCKLPYLIQFTSKFKPANNDSCLSNFICSSLFLKVSHWETSVLEVPSVTKKKKDDCMNCEENITTIHSDFFVNVRVMCFFSYVYNH